MHDIFARSCKIAKTHPEQFQGLASFSCVAYRLHILAVSNQPSNGRKGNGHDNHRNRVRWFRARARIVARGSDEVIGKERRPLVKRVGTKPLAFPLRR
jgi:hypothetical protein